MKYCELAEFASYAHAKARPRLASGHDETEKQETLSRPVHDHHRLATLTTQSDINYSFVVNKGFDHPPSTWQRVVPAVAVEQGASRRRARRAFHGAARRSLKHVATPGTPAWPNPWSSTQLETENGRRSNFGAVVFAAIQAVPVPARGLERRRRRTFSPVGNIVNANSSRTPSAPPTRSTSKCL